MSRILFFVTILAFLLTAQLCVAKDAPYITPEEYATMSFAPKRNTLYTVNSASYSERIGLIRSFRDVQRNRAKILNQDLSTNKIAITQTNLKNISKISDFINQSFETGEKDNFAHLIRIGDPQIELPPEDSATISDPKTSDSTITNPEESDTVKHLSVRQKFSR